MIIGLRSGIRFSTRIATSAATKFAIAEITKTVCHPFWTSNMYAASGPAQIDATPLAVYIRP